MASPEVMAPVVTGLPLSGTDLNNNLSMIEDSFVGVACDIISGLLVTPGSGLSVNVASGTAVLGAMRSIAAFVIGGLPPTTNPVHLYLNMDGTGSFNATGIPPAKSIKLGTCVTGASTVTSVSMGRTSGRQQFVQPQNLVPGGPSAGTASAGHLGSIDLSNWNASAAEGKSVFGTLPAGALPAAFTAPVVFTDTDAGTATTPNVVTLQHRSTGTPAASFGSTLLMQADNAANALANQFAVASAWSSAAAGTESSLAILRIRYLGTDVEVARLRPVGTAPAGGVGGQFQASSDFFHSGALAGFFGTAPVARPGSTTDLRQALINLGLYTTGGATPLNLNGGNLTAADILGAYVAAGPLGIVEGPAVVDFELSGPVNRGAGLSMLGPVDSGSGFYGTGQWLFSLYNATAPTPQKKLFLFEAEGTYDNTGTLSGCDAWFQAGVSPDSQHFAWTVDHDTGRISFGQFIWDGQASVFPETAATKGFVVRAHSGQTARLAEIQESSAAVLVDVTAAGDLEFRRTSSTTGGRAALDQTIIWANSTDATRKARAVFNIWDTVAREALRLEASGTAPMIGVLGAAAAVQQTGGAATAGALYTATEQGMLQKAYDALRTFGFLS